VLRTAGLGLSAVGVLAALTTVNLRTTSEPQIASERARPTVQAGASGAAEPADQGTPRAAQATPAEHFSPTVALRYQTDAGQFVLLEVAPFQVGENTFRVTVLNTEPRPIAVQGVSLRFSRLERDGDAEDVVAAAAEDGRSFLATYILGETGWWAIDVSVQGQPAASFTLRLDKPSKAPLTFAPPDYQSDPAVERLFRQTVERYEQLDSVRWREELTSGLGGPAGLGAWILSTGEAEAPDRLHLRVLSPGFSEYELYRIGRRRCTQDKGKSWQCTNGESEATLDLEYQKPSTAFRLGRRERIGGETARVLLFYNPSQPAWYAWWVGEETGNLYKQAMVAPGHFMLARFSDHNAPASIVMPAQAQ
jgi:hypothetical protein